MKLPARGPTRSTVRPSPLNAYILSRRHEAGKVRTDMSPFDQGVAAAQTGMSKDDNPYQWGTAAYSDWNAGYESVVEADEATKLDGE